MKQRKQRKDFSQTALATVEKVIGGKLVEPSRAGIPVAFVLIHPKKTSLGVKFPPGYFETSGDEYNRVMESAMPIIDQLLAQAKELDAK